MLWPFLYIKEQALICNCFQSCFFHFRLIHPEQLKHFPLNILIIIIQNLLVERQKHYLIIIYKSKYLLFKGIELFM